MRPKKFAHAVDLWPHGVDPARWTRTRLAMRKLSPAAPARPPFAEHPLRVRARSSCLANLSVVNELCRGGLMADVPAVVGSLDIVMGEIDR